MKKIYLLASVLMISAAATAQETTPANRVAPTNLETYQNERPVIGQDRAPGDVIGSYQDDFSTAANWNTTNTSSPSGNFQINSTGASVGAAFASTTSGNGFAWYDCDAIGVDLGSTTDAVVAYGSTMDFSSNAAVAVSFESYYIEYQTQVFVEVSTAGLGGPWTQYEVHLAVTDNGSSPNPELINVNISSQAGNQANVAVRFHITGGWGFQWSVDDFKMIEAYEHELETTWSHFSSGVETNEYYAVPTDQITEITFGSIVISNGVTNQTTVEMDADVDGGSTYAGTSMQAVTLMEAQSDSFSIEAGSGWTPAGAGSYDLVITAGSDQVEQLPANNDVTHEPIVVGGNIYARDNGLISGGFAGFTTTVGDPIAVGNTFEMFSDVTFSTVNIGLTTAAASEGQLMYAAVYKWNGVDNFDFVAQSPDYQVAATDLGAIVSLNLSTAVSALTGDLFLVCAGHYGGTTPTSFAQAQATQEQTVLAVHSSGLIAGADPAVMIVRISYTPSQIGMEEVDAVTGMNVYPNPANNSTLLSYNIVNEGNVALTLTDLSGKIVHTENYGSQVEGQYNVDLSTAALSNGVYFYTVTVGEKAVTKKFVVAH